MQCVAFRLEMNQIVAIIKFPFDCTGPEIALLNIDFPANKEKLIRHFHAHAFVREYIQLKDREVLNA